MKKNVVSLLQDNVDITTRYRISSLVRRRPYVSLFFAIDNQQLRPVGIRDIDISGLGKEGRANACDVVQQEYDLLRRESIPSLMPVIEVRHFEGHLYVVSAWPSHSNKSEMTNTHLQTLQDVLQSGIGLPKMQVSLYWVEQLCSALVNLHQQHIVLGDLDPQALILDGNNYNGDLLLMVSWLPSLIRNILPPTSVVNNATNFSAPEVLLGKPEPRSDIYSLGAVLYLLLTGVPPEEPTARIHRSLRSPGEVNPRINGRLDEFVMKALAIETTERFQDASEMSEALARLRAGGKRTFSKVSTALQPTGDGKREKENFRADQARARERKIDEIANSEAVLVAPLSETDLTLWEAAKRPTNRTPAVEQLSSDVMRGEIEQVDTVDVPQRDDQRDDQVASSQSVAVSTISDAANTSPAGQTAGGGAPKFLRQLQRFVLGEQKHSTTAAAIIETPLRVQPDQAYAIRIQLMGRNAPAVGNPQGTFSWPENKKSVPAGLSGLVEGELVFIEIRSALYQSFAYIVQRATVHIPAQGFAAEVTIPMQPLSSGPSGRRDRLHIFFMDEKRRPLYEKPFVVELFISNLVQPGREGHNVLTIPI